MTSEEIKNAMHGFLPVVYDGIEYRRIMAYTYRVVESLHHKGTYRPVYECELLSKSGNSVTIADSKKVELAGGNANG